MKPFAIFAGILACLLFTSSAVAQVYRSDSGLGSALILPYWTVAAGNDTLIGVSNDSTRATALKLRVLDEEGELLSHFNLYLDARSQWGGALARIDGQTLLLPSEVGCMLPAPSASHNGRPAIPLDAPRGTVEIIEMGRAGDASGLADEVRWAECAVLADAFDSGAWSEEPDADMAAPTQQLSAQATLINVAAGGMNTVPATAIGNFSDIVQHTVPASELPDLTHAFDSGAANGGVRSLVCVEGGCRIDEWEQPIEALAAVLMASELTVGYSVDPGLAAEFEWAMHRPLRRYEEDVESVTFLSDPYMHIRSSNGSARLATGCFTFTPPPPPGCLPGEAPIAGQVILQSFPFNSVFELGAPTVESSILGHLAPIFGVFALAGEGEFDSPFLGGTARVRLDRVENLTAADGVRFLGEPVISFAVQQFSNGTLTDDQGQNVLSNYRRTELPRQILILRPPN